ncbi:MAG: TRAP transporter substrate-binding protein [Lautropia sp.]
MRLAGNARHPRSRFTAAFAAALAAATTTLAPSVGIAADKPVTLKLSHWVPPTHVIAKGSIADWTDAVEKASGGTLKFQVFPAGQLGKAESHYDLARDGIADVVWHNPGFNAGRFPIFAASQLPLMVGDSPSGSHALTEWYRQYEAKEMGDVKVCLAYLMYPLYIWTREKVVYPEDLKGMKIRPSSAMEATYIKLAGGSPVPGAYPQSREMIERGVLDGTTGVPASALAFGVDKAVKYTLTVPLSQPSYVLAINKAKYASLSDAQKKALDAHCTPEAAKRFSAFQYEAEGKGIPALKARNDAGREITEPSAEVMQRWQKLAPQVVEQWAKEVSARGEDPAKVLAGFRQGLEKQGALIK